MAWARRALSTVEFIEGRLKRGLNMAERSQRMSPFRSKPKFHRQG
jgi:hypothetical protein